MRWLVVLSLVAACETTPYQTTPLDGSTECGTSTCGAGEVCVNTPAGVDAAAGGGGGAMCFLPPKGCYIFDCSGVRCAPCIQALCSLEPVEVAVRNVYCPAQ
ncbi:MAG: hypothetical protein IPQ07_05815 [Myxococcales bacterium]|nr:hypothetical protein [Myxococcales bacterium]